VRSPSSACDRSIGKIKLRARPPTSVSPSRDRFPPGSASQPPLPASGRGTREAAGQAARQAAGAGLLHYTAPMVKLRKQHEILNNPQHMPLVSLVVD